MGISRPSWLETLPATFELKASGANATRRWISSHAEAIHVEPGDFAGTLYLLMYVAPNPDLQSSVDAVFWVRLPGDKPWIGVVDSGAVVQGTGDFTPFVAYRPSRDEDVLAGGASHLAHYPFGVNPHGTEEIPLWDYPENLEISVYQPPYSQWEVWQQIATPPAPPVQPPERDCPPRPEWPYTDPVLEVGQGPATVMRLR